MLGNYFNYPINLVKRFAILVPGLVVAYVSVKDIYPFINQWAPRAVAILLTYILAAYVLIPALMRIALVFFRPKHIPLYATTPDGFANDPVNIGVVATHTELLKVMRQAGWYRADKRTARNLLHMVTSVLLRRQYKNAPFSSLFLFGRKQDEGFQQPDGSSPHKRHHVRFWAASYPTSKKHEHHAFFWQRHYSPSGERIFWVGCVSLDTGIGIIRHNAQFTHRVHADTDKERDLLIHALTSHSTAHHVYTKQITKPYKLKNRVLKNHMRTDGVIKIVEL